MLEQNFHSWKGALALSTVELLPLVRLPGDGSGSVASLICSKHTDTFAAPTVDN